MSNTEAMRAALEALERVTTSETFYRDPRGDTAGPAIDALNAALAQAERPEACAWVSNKGTEEEAYSYSGHFIKHMRALKNLYAPILSEMAQPKQHAPGLYLDSGEFIPAEELNKARNKE